MLVFSSLAAPVTKWGGSLAPFSSLIHQVAGLDTSLEDPKEPAACTSLDATSGAAKQSRPRQTRAQARVRDDNA